MKLISIGFNNMIADTRVVALIPPDSAPAKRMVQDAKENGRAIDCTGGRKTKTVIVTDSEHIILSALSPETVSNRLNGIDADGEDN